MSDLINVARPSDVPTGEGRVVDANGTPIALFNLDGNFHALDNTCIHRGGPLGDGICDEATVTCARPGWQCEVASGQCINSPGDSVESDAGRVEGEDVQVKL